MKVLAFYVLKKKYKFESDYFIFYKRSGEPTIIDEMFAVDNSPQFKKIQRRKRRWEYYCILQAVNWKASTLKEIYLEWNNRKNIAFGDYMRDEVSLIAFYEDDELVIIVYKEERPAFRVKNYFDIGIKSNVKDPELEEQLKVLQTNLTDTKL